MSDSTDGFSGVPDVDTSQHRWDESGHPCMDIVEAVASATGRDELELPPLQQAVDTDALDALLVTGATNLRVSFAYGGVRVHAYGDGSIELRTQETDSR